MAILLSPMYTTAKPGRPKPNISQQIEEHLYYVARSSTIFARSRMPQYIEVFGFNTNEQKQKQIFIIR